MSYKNISYIFHVETFLPKRVILTKFYKQIIKIEQDKLSRELLKSWKLRNRFSETKL